MLANHSSTVYDEVAVLFAVATGDQKAFGELFFRYKDRVYTIALTYTENRVIAEEVVQDVFVRVWKNRQKLKEIDSFSSWIAVIARNRALTALQKIAREGKRRSALISYLPGEVSDAEERVQDNQLEELLENALTRLSPQQRKVFVLSRLQGHSRQEVAEMLNLAPATVSVHLTLALKSIRAFLTNHPELSSLVFLFCYC
ncbi:MAG TPA: RNA polymerase sigma-70 factor [Puia sp.]|nr:RNA polymerase sigma-70 factor [Puia sp.]